ncbi:MAG: hybrid sensor histidine kinase/response regulator, partial [Lysobacterales bacterium]
QNLQREIHTFKGGARMAGLEGLGTFAHAMENLFEQIAEGRVEATILSVQALEEGCDKLNLWVERIQGGTVPTTDAAQARFEKQVRALHSGQELPAEDTAQPPLATPAEPVEARPPARPVETPAAEPEQPVPATPATTEPAAPAAGRDIRVHRKPPAAPKTPPVPRREVRDIPDRPAAAAQDAGPGAQIRVAADLMDKLVNYAGEVSIYRARLEQQIGSVRGTLKDVNATVMRLKEQLRKLDMESEAQIMSRYQSEPSRDSNEFDPLELDRFSNMQQLSRGLAESASDLLSLHEMLDESVRTAENLLTQQSRVSSDLQAGLMQTRMTPFGSAAPRLRRIVRTAAAETGKKARLQLKMVGSSDQLDRNVLERITAPLEHMLRNAIAHGIETPKERKKQGKPEEGSITVTVEAEATEFVIRVQDDGAGVNLEAVRKRAIERGLMSEDEALEPQQLVQFIRHSGFSTADQVTGLAGRGVGMDVVDAEIKQIGGSLDISSEPGVGTLFSIHIPFSLAVMQAIGVSVGGRLFQVPLNSVAGVARLSPAEYSELLRSDDPGYEFAGEDYPILELEPLLGEDIEPLDSDNISLLMISAGDYRAAFRVNDLKSHQEVVIKPVGPQVSSIPGILGGTIAPDGQVMLILDMGPLIRRGLEIAAQPSAEVLEPAKKESRQPLIMVVDDSITMRKVTRRVLENHALEVALAEDGVDAVEKMRDVVPDLVLLDIEMPRMDGYELLTHIRADARLRHVPVVMITSRAGQKHRKKAREAGANDYLTKPYQEVDLVEKVSELLDLPLVPGRQD